MRVTTNKQKQQILVIQYSLRSLEKDLKLASWVNGCGTTWTVGAPR